MFIFSDTRIEEAFEGKQTNSQLVYFYLLARYLFLDHAVISFPFY